MVRPLTSTPPIGQEAGDAFSGGAQLQLVPHGEQYEVAWEAMA